MAQMIITICMRKPIDELEEGRQLYEMVKERLADHPEVHINGSIHNNLTEPPTPPEPT